MSLEVSFFNEISKYTNIEYSNCNLKGLLASYPVASVHMAMQPNVLHVILFASHVQNAEACKK